MKYFKSFCYQLLTVIITAGLLMSFAYLLYWLFNPNNTSVSSSQSLWSNPFLWGAVIIAVILSLVSRFWRYYAEYRFIKTYKKHHHKSKVR